MLGLLLPSGAPVGPYLLSTYCQSHGQKINNQIFKFNENNNNNRNHSLSVNNKFKKQPYAKPLLHLSLIYHQLKLVSTVSRKELQSAFEDINITNELIYDR